AASGPNTPSVRHEVDARSNALARSFVFSLIASGETCVGMKEVLALTIPAGRAIERHVGDICLAGQDPNCSRTTERCLRLLDTPPKTAAPRRAAAALLPRAARGRPAGPSGAGCRPPGWRNARPSS